MVETKIIILDQQEIVYKIHYKRIKNCYLRVEKGEVVIRCSPLFPQSEIEKLIRNHQEEILEQIKGYVPKYNYQEDGYVYLFNQKYQIVLKDMNIKKCAIHDPHPHLRRVHGPPASGPGHRRQNRPAGLWPPGRQPPRP